MTPALKTKEPLRPARLLVSAAVSPTEFSKKFTPQITNTPALPAVNWSVIGQQAPKVLPTPSSLPTADAVVVTWAESEWAPLVHVFNSSNTSMTYTERSESSWSGWVKDTQGAPSELGFWGYYNLVQVGSAKVLLYKSNAHYAASNGEQDLEALTNRWMQNVKPSLILSVGTAGGARTSDPVGTVNVVHADALYESNQPQNAWPHYASAWTPNWSLIGEKSFSKLLFPIPTTAADIDSIVTQFNRFYNTSYALSVLNPDNLNMGAAEPAINNLVPGGAALVTAKSFVVANTSGNLSTFACVEMDDAIIARTAATGKTQFGSLRNVSDPVQNVALPATFQGNWGEAIYTAYGFYTSYNGALAACALLGSQFAGK